MFCYISKTEFNFTAQHIVKQKSFEEQKNIYSLQYLKK